MTAHNRRPPRLCEVPGCGRRHRGRGYCATHLARLHTDGDVRADEPIRSPAEHGTSYWGARQRLYTTRGAADAQQCAGCAAPARCWSYDGGDPDERRDPGNGVHYSLDLDRYRPRCWSCHRRATSARWRNPEMRAERRAHRAARLSTDDPSSDGPGCLVPGCEGEHSGRGYCHTHLSRLHRVGDVRADVPIQHKRTHGKVSYWSVLQRLGGERGPARGQTCTDCGGAALSWSYDRADPDERTSPEGYRYSLNLDHYRPRCRPCHRRATNAGAAPRAKAAVEDVERAVWLYERGVSAAGIGAVFGVSRTAVLNALRSHGVIIRRRGSRAPLGQPLAETAQS